MAARRWGYDGLPSYQFVTVTRFRWSAWTLKLLSCTASLSRRAALHHVLDAPVLEEGGKHPKLRTDDDLPLGMTFFQVCKRICDLLEWKHPIGHRFQLATIDQSRQHIKVVSAGMHH